MHDLIDTHRSNIARAGVALAAAIADATGAYSAAIAASEAELELLMERRVAAFNGGAAEPPVLVVQLFHGTIEPESVFTGRFADDDGRSPSAQATEA